MKNEIVVPLERKHLEQVYDLGKMPLEQPVNRSQFDEFVVPDQSFALVDSDGIVLGAAGVWTIWPGVGEAWAILTEDLKKKPILLHKTVQKYLKKIVEEQKFHRVQFIVLYGFIAAESWAHALGFTHEGIMYQYGTDKSTYHRFARIYG